MLGYSVKDILIRGLFQTIKVQQLGIRLFSWFLMKIWLGLRCVDIDGVQASRKRPRSLYCMMHLFGSSAFLYKHEEVRHVCHAFYYVLFSQRIVLQALEIALSLHPF